MTTQAKIDDALQSRDAFAVIDQVKEAVAAEIAAVDSSITVRKTEYFNHSFVPDLVVWWGQRDSQHRPVFLRFDSADPYVAQDLRRLDGAPMVFSLATREREQVAEDVLVALSENPRTLLTDAGGVGALVGAPSESFESIVTNSIVREGRGFADGELIHRVRSNATNGLEAALLADDTATAAAIHDARLILADAGAQRVEKFLQLMWTAGGASLATYPGSQELNLDLGASDLPEVLRLVLASSRNDSVDYWRRLGTLLSLEAIEGIGYAEPSENLQRLVTLNVDRLFVSWAAATNEGSRRISEEGVPDARWMVVDGRLALSGPDWTIRFSDDGRHFRSVHKDHPLLSVEEVVRRVGSLRIESLRLDDDHVAVTVESKGTSDESAAAAMEGFAGMLDRLAGVRSVTVRSGLSIVADFTRLLASVRDGGKVPVTNLAHVAVALLTASDDDERAQVLSILPTVVLAGRSAVDQDDPSPAVSTQQSLL